MMLFSGGGRRWCSGSCHGSDVGAGTSEESSGGCLQKASSKTDQIITSLFPGGDDELQ